MKRTTTDELIASIEAERLADARRWNEIVARGNEIARQQREAADLLAEELAFVAESDDIAFEQSITALCATNPYM